LFTKNALKTQENMYMSNLTYLYNDRTEPQPSSNVKRKLIWCELKYQSRVLLFSEIDKTIVLLLNTINLTIGQLITRGVYAAVVIK